MRISPDAARLGRDHVEHSKRHVITMTSRADDDDDDDDDDVYVGSHGNRAAATAADSGWTDLYHRQSRRLGLSPMSTCSAAVTIGQS